VHNSAGPAKDPWLMNLMDHFEVQYKKRKGRIEWLASGMICVL